MSTYSDNLALELITSGDQSGVWGTTTNTNLGTLIEQAISGYVTYACSGSDDTITIPNGASGVARNMYIELTGAGGGNLLVPVGKEKLYFIYNNTSTSAAAVTVKVSGQTGVSVPAGKKMILVSNGTDVFDATNYVTALAAGTLAVTGAVTLSTALSAANGGTGLSSPGTAGNILTSTGTGWQSSAASTFVSNVTATSPLSSSGGNTPDISLGTVPVTKGGTGVTSATAYALLAGGTTSTGAVQSIASVGTAGQLLTSNGAGALPSFQTVTVSYIPLMDVKTSGSGTWTIPSGVTRVRVTVTGGGGNGSTGLGGGGGGGTAIKILTVVAGALSYSVGGAATSSTVSSGTNNTISTITGGAGTTATSEIGGAGGAGLNGDINFTGNGGGTGIGTDLDIRYGGAGGGSYFGGGARSTINSAGVSGFAYGGGGSGSNGGLASTGFGGVIIFEY
jgi:hypothetical protein